MARIFEIYGSGTKSLCKFGIFSPSLHCESIPEPPGITVNDGIVQVLHRIAGSECEKCVSEGFDSLVQIEVRKSATLAERRSNKVCSVTNLLRHKVKEESQERIPRERV